METYILQFGLDKNSQDFIQNVRNEIRIAGFVDRQRGWLPHITIDKYDGSNFEELIEKINQVIANVSAFKINLETLNNFDKETLFVEPEPKDKVLEIKSELDIALDKFRFESRRMRGYNPHITLCTNNNLEECEKIAYQHFSKREATIERVWLYTEKNMELVKEWVLKN